MGTTRVLQLSMVAVGIATLLTVWPVIRPSAQPAQPGAVQIDNDDIGGVVTSPRGPEAGVWVIAETTDLGTRFAKSVVTDAHGRYVVPDLPKATYNVWVRGYGLVDSPKVKAEPGAIVNLKAVLAPNAAAAVLFHPEFYKAAVANSGCHDNRMDKASWNEQWMGYPVGPQYAECSNIENAGRLQGHLLLIVGEMDDLVNPEMASGTQNLIKIRPGASAARPGGRSTLFFAGTCRVRRGRRSGRADGLTGLTPRRLRGPSSPGSGGPVHIQSARPRSRPAAP